MQHHYTQQVDFAQLKSELQLMEKNELAMIKAENDRLVTDVDKLKQRLREEITRTQAGVRLDLNLEKGHDIFELHVWVNLDEEGLAELGDECEFHCGCLKLG